MQAAGRTRVVIRAVVALGLGALTACGAPTAQTAQTARPTTLQWERLPDPPLTPRFLTELFWTGSELLAIGGDPNPPCPPNANCIAGPLPAARDGTAFDPATSTWRRIADAPRALEGDALVSGDVIWARTGWQADDPLLSYDASEDRWTSHPPPPGTGPASYNLAVSRGQLVALRTDQQLDRSRDALYDPSTRSWSALPPDPMAPSFDRTAVDTAHGLLVTGAESVANPGSDKPAYLRAALLDVGRKTWRRLPDSEQLVGAGIALHGDRAIWPDLGGADGGEVNGYGRVIPFGGVLDLASQRWLPLENAPDERSGGWPAYALGGAISATEGYLYDDRDRSWTSIPQPADGPAAPGAAGWAGHDLVVVGGTTEPGDDYRRVQGAWVLRAAGR